MARSQHAQGEFGMPTGIVCLATSVPDTQTLDHNSPKLIRDVDSIGLPEGASLVATKGIPHSEFGSPNLLKAVLRAMFEQEVLSFVAGRTGR